MPRINSLDDNKKLPGGLGATTFIVYARNYGVELTYDEAAPLCTLWKETFPETMEYLKDPGPELDEFAPAPDPGDPKNVQEIRERFKYKCVTLTGRRRARCSYTQACNTGFQGLSADSTKLAMWNLYKAGYVMENVVHDETITLLPFDRNLTARAAHIQSIMVNSMRVLTPDVNVKAEPALMFRWAKSAEPYFADDVLLPWEIVPRDREGHVVEWKDLSAFDKGRLRSRLEDMYDMAERLRTHG